MPRFFIEKSRICGQCIEVEGADFHHMTRVLRMAPGDEAVFCDGFRNDYRCVLGEFKGESLRAQIVDAWENQSEPSVFCTLFQALPKGDKMDTIVQKSVELGVSRIVPFSAARCVVRLSGTDAKKKTSRWQAIALEAAKQCGRGIVPRVEDVMSFDQALAAMNADANAVLYEGERQTRLSSLLPGRELGSFSFMTGPEGGFEEKEIEKARSAGIATVTLGPRILRTETASSCVLSVLMYATGNLH